MPLLRRLAALLILAALFAADAASAQTTKVTFILVNDIYIMGDQAMPDGRRRGGFARLAAIVKAERAKAKADGGHVILAHAGDTLSPSLMSGLDRGEHIIALTNMIAPEIFAPGNHEFDFGKEIFFKRMGEAKFPLYAANLRMPDGKPLPGFRDREIITLDGVRIGLTGTTFDGTPRASSPGDLQFLPTVSTTVDQAGLLRKEGADFVVAVTHAERKQDYEMFATRSIDLILTGHDHDLFINYDERNAMVELSYDAHYITAIDVTISVKEQDGRRVTTWWPQFRPIDTATVTPDPEVAAVVAKYRGRVHARDGRAARHHRGRARQPQCHRAHARGRDRQPDRRRHARINQGRRRDHQWRRHPLRQGLSAGLDHHPPRRAGGAAVRQPHRGAGDPRRRTSRPRSRTGCRNCPMPADVFRRYLV